MDFLISFFVFILGAIIGSFLNVVICRYNTGSSVFRGRSQCLACGKALRWFELVPLLSFVLQAGRCRSCLSRISWQYPAVELFTALLFVLIVNLNLPWHLSLIQLAAWSLLLVIVVYDLRHKIIPDGLVFAFAGLSLLHLFLVSFQPAGVFNGRIFAAGGMAGLILFAALAAIWLFSRGRLMGLGDAKLALGIGFFLGLRGSVSALILAFWSGAVVGLLLILFSRLSLPRRYFTMKSELPFAPFIVLGAALNLFFQINVFTLFL